VNARYRHRAVDCLLLLALSFSGCVHKPYSKPASVENGTIFMEPLHILSQPDQELGLSVFDAAVLFQEGLRLQEAAEYDQALRYYERLLHDFGDSRYYSAAAFNAGRCYEEKGEFEKAIGRYQLILDGLPHSKDWVNAAFRSGGCFILLERHAEAAALYARLLTQSDLATADRIDAQVARGEELVAASDLIEAEKAFRAALHLYREHERDEYLDPAPAARAEFNLADLLTRTFQLAPLRLPDDQIERDLEAKALALLEAQNGYLRSMRLGDPTWATASGYRIGRLYVDFYNALDNAPVPPDLTDEEVTTYRQLLRQRLGVLLRKALKVFEMTLQIAERTHVDNQWIAAARQEMTLIEEQVLSLLKEAEQSSTNGTEPSTPAVPNENQDRTDNK
jgi:tetratricopeptide (TPR) repeat protein